MHDADGIRADAVLVERENVAQIFGYTRSYLHADLATVGDAIVFLHTLLPNKPVDEIYTVLGRAKQGKTERYRHFFRHLGADPDEQFDRAHGFLAPAGEAARQCVGDAHRAQAGVRVRRAEPVVVEDLLADARQIAPDRIAVARDRMRDAVGRIDVEGDELGLRVDAADAEEAPRQRVEPGLVQLLVEQTGNRRRVGVAHRAPERAIGRRCAEHAFDALDHFADAVVVQLDALARVVLRAFPVARFETALRAFGNRGKARVVVGEAGAQFARADVDQGLVDLVARGRGRGVHGRSLCKIGHRVICR